MSIGHPAGGLATVSGGPGSVEPYAEVTITNTRTGRSVTVTALLDGSFSTAIAAAVGDVLHIEAADAAGNDSEYRPFTVTASGGDLPPDPATVAPLLDETEVTPLYEATAFLYSGTNPIQTGVAEGIIEPRRAAVVRGRVLARDHQPLSGVTLSIKDHPEFGQTLSRADGMFDMAVNGGGLLTSRGYVHRPDLERPDPDRPRQRLDRCRWLAPGHRALSPRHRGHDDPARWDDTALDEPARPGHRIHRRHERAESHARSLAADLGLYLRGGVECR